MYYLVPVNNGVLDIDYRDMIEGIHNTATQALVHLVDSAVVRSTWTVKTQADWDNAKAPTLEQLKSSKLLELEQAYESCFTTFQSSALGSVHTYPCDPKARESLKELAQEAVVDTTLDSFEFKTIEDGIVVHTRAQFTQLLRDFKSFEVGLDKKFETKDKQRTSSATNDQVNSIVWSDTTAPAAPTGLTGTPGTGIANLTWTANSEIDVQIGGSYNVYKAGTKLANVITTSYTATGLTSGTSATFTVSAVDSDGNESPQSASVTITPN